MEECIEEKWFSIRQCNESISIYIRNINLLLWTVAKKSITKNYSTGCIKRKRSEQIQIRWKMKENWFSIPQYNLSLLFCKPNINFLSYIVLEISLTKTWRENYSIDCMERKNKQENAYSQSHDVISHCQSSILKSCWEIYYETLQY